MFLDEQLDNERRATELIGEPIYNAAAEELGNIDDIVLNEDGEVIAVLVGIGGFLGIGERSVAISWSSLEQERTAEDDVRLILDVNREALENAPESVLLEDQPAEPAAGGGAGGAGGGGAGGAGGVGGAR